MASGWQLPTRTLTLRRRRIEQATGRRHPSHTLSWYSIDSNVPLHTLSWYSIEIPSGQHCCLIWDEKDKCLSKRQRHPSHTLSQYWMEISSRHYCPGLLIVVVSYWHLICGKHLLFPYLKIKRTTNRTPPFTHALWILNRDPLWTSLRSLSLEIWMEYMRNTTGLKKRDGKIQIMFWYLYNMPCIIPSSLASPMNCGLLSGFWITAIVSPSW